jgi:hypothetical protein
MDEPKNLRATYNTIRVWYEVVIGSISFQFANEAEREALVRNSEIGTTTASIQ